MGELKRAASNLRQQIEIDREIGAEYDQSAGHSELGLLLTYTGRYDQADNELEAAFGVLVEHHDEAGQCIVWSYRSRRAVLMDRPQSALEALKKARVSWDQWTKKRYPLEPNLVEISLLSGAVKRLAGDLDGCGADLNEALSRCRRIRLVEFEPDILLEIAKLRWQEAMDGGQKTEGEKQDLAEQAKSLAREALEIADRCEYRLKQADIHNFLAETALAEGDKENALKHAGIAKERAWCDGPPYCYRKALDQAEQMLAKLQ